jgi:hypothetical protein
MLVEELLDRGLHLVRAELFAAMARPGIFSNVTSTSAFFSAS